MFFKNLSVYNIDNFNLKELELSKLLEKRKFVACTDSQFSKCGWSSVLKGDGEEKLAISCHDYMFFQLKTETKIIPASVIGERLRGKLEEMKLKKDDRLEGNIKKLKNELKETIVLEMLKTAFATSKFLNAYIDLKNNIIVIDSSSSSAAENLISELRTCLGSFVATPVEFSECARFMTRSIGKLGIDAPFSLNSHCKLSGLDKASIVIKNVNLQSEEVSLHVSSGMNVVQLDLNWNGRIDFSLHELGLVRCIKMGLKIKEDLSDENRDPTDIYGTFQTEAFLMGGELSKLLKDLSDAIGKEENEDEDEDEDEE